jgi:hypothetical protein
MSSSSPPTYFFDGIDFNSELYKQNSSGYAVDNLVVHKSQSETITGAKSFTSTTTLATTNVSQLSLGFGIANQSLMFFGDTTTGNGGRISYGTTQANLNLMARHTSIPQINLITSIGGAQTTQLSAKTSGIVVPTLVGTGNRAVYSDANGLLTNTASDFRLKENIQAIPETDMLLKIIQLEPKTFNWKSNGEDDIGFIAQEVNEVLPELVVERNDGFLSVNYDRIPTLLVCCIKQLQEQINALKLQVAQLQN